MNISHLIICLLIKQVLAEVEENIQSALPINIETLDPVVEDVISFYDNKTVKIIEGDHRIIFWTSTENRMKHAEVSLKDDFSSELNEHREFFTNEDVSLSDEYFPANFTLESNVAVYGYINITGKFVGYNWVKVTMFDSTNKTLANGKLNVGITLKQVHITKIYEIGLTIILIFVYITMGANLDLNLVKMIVKKPVGPLIGLFCQYICMPLIAFGLGFIIFPDEPLLRLGLFASGSSPGGGLSNMWTHLLGGSLDLSIMMTFASTVVALGAVPLWLLLMGPVIIKDTDFVIPYINVIILIFLLIVPCFVGIVIQMKLPRVTKFLRMIITPMSILNILFILTIGVYANYYLFSYLTWQAVIGGMGQSLCGHLVGIIMALLFRRNMKEVIAISIETAVQNNAIAYLILQLSLESPAGDIAVLMPASVVFFMPIPLTIACLIRVIYIKCYRKDTQDMKTNVGDGDDPPPLYRGNRNSIKGIDNPVLKLEERSL